MATNKKEYQREWYQKNKAKRDAKNQIWRNQNKAHISKRNREYLETVNGRSRRFMVGCRRRAAAKGWDFDLDLEWLREKIEVGHCEVTGIKFSMEGARNPFSPSIDRKDCSKGYTKENCQMVAFIYNLAKGDFTHEDVLTLARSLSDDRMPTQP